MHLRYSKTCGFTVYCIFEQFQRVWSQSTNVIETYQQTDRWSTAPPHKKNLYIISDYLSRLDCSGPLAAEVKFCQKLAYLKLPIRIFWPCQLTMTPAIDFKIAGIWFKFGKVAGVTCKGTRKFQRSNLPSPWRQGIKIAMFTLWTC